MGMKKGSMSVSYEAFVFFLFKKLEFVPHIEFADYRSSSGWWRCLETGAGRGGHGAWICKEVGG